MVTEEDIEWITKELETGKVNAIVANKAIWTFRLQQREILQLKQQLISVQKIVSQLSLDLEASKCS